METKVQPIINKYWSDDAFPYELLPSFKELRLGGLGFEGWLPPMARFEKNGCFGLTEPAAISPTDRSGNAGRERRVQRASSL
jgi:hypothetical protein